VKKSKRIPWKCPPVHPAVLKYGLQMMNDAELEAMGENYKANGLLFPIVIFVDNRGEERGEKGPFPETLIAGRNRLKMLERIGINDPRDATIASSKLYGAIHKVNAIRQQGYLRLSDGSVAKQWVVETDPELYVLASDVHRRHLTAEQRDAAIAAYVKVDPLASNREVGRALSVSHTTVGAVRAEEGMQSGQSGQIAHSPIERARAALKENPELSNRAVAKATGVSPHTAAAARRAPAKLQERPLAEAKPAGGPQFPSKEDIRRRLANISMIANRIGLTDEEIISIVRDALTEASLASCDSSQ
jgi:hypothetical protein